MGKAGNTKKPTLPQKSGSRVVSFEKKGKGKNKNNKTHQDRNREKKIAKYQSDSEDSDEDKLKKLNIKEEDEEAVSMNDDESPAIQLPRKDDSTSKKRTKPAAKREAEEAPQKKQKRSKQPEIEEERSSASDDEDVDGASADDEGASDDEGDLPSAGASGKHKKTYAETIEDILNAEVPKDKKGNVKLLSKKAPTVKEKKELQAAVEAEQERKREAERDKLRYLIANKNHVVPTIVDNVAEEKGMKKLTTKAVVQFFTAMHESRKGYVEPTKQKKVLVKKEQQVEDLAVKKDKFFSLLGNQGKYVEEASVPVVKKDKKEKEKPKGRSVSVKSEMLDDSYVKSFKKEADDF